DLPSRPTAGQRQPHRFTPKLRCRSVPVSHETPPGSSVGALHIFRASPDCLGEWISELTVTHLFGPGDPLFPKPKIEGAGIDGFRCGGLSKDHYKWNDQLRKFIKATFVAAGLPPFTPHRFRNTLVAMSNRFIVTPEELKAVSMNLGHSSVRTTIDDYGQLSPQRQGEVLKALRKRIREAEGLG
ncbi:MAG: hypothetical protein O9328_02400, partial [Rhodobacteraceae bacterium]|nr:hypothetical protein [Paracoccaceae bacterium]